MPAGKTNSYSDSVLNLLRGSNVTAFSPYVGLMSVAPTDDNSTGTELSGSGYSRQSITFGAPADEGTGGRKVSNTNVIRFGPASANWSAAVAFGIYDAASSGNLRYWGTMTTVTVVSSSSLEIAIGDLSVVED
jgi:hypothetical protein